MRRTCWIPLSLLLVVGCGAQAPPKPPPHLVLIVVDNLRADHLGAYGYDRPTSPVIDGIAREGTLFLRARSPSSWTKPAIGSLFTSRLPSEHGAVAFGRDLDRSLPTLASQLRAAGYQTLGASGNFVHINRETGMARGFDRWKSLAVEVDDEDSPLGLFGRRAPTAREINGELRRRLDKLDPSLPLFLYAHYMEPHAPFAPPESVRARFLPETSDAPAIATTDRLIELAAGRAVADPAEREWLVALYDAEIAVVDAAVAELLELLHSKGYGENLVLALVSDHGEEFGEHGAWFHGLQLHEESLRVPMLFHGNAIPPARRDDAVDLLDVPVTLLAQAGLAPPPGARGRDLLAEPLVERELVAELHPGALFEGRVRKREHRVAVEVWPWKSILSRDGSHALYRLDRDPQELAPMASNDPEAPSSFVARVEAAAQAAARPGAPVTVPLDDETRRALRSLGYAE